MGRIPPEDLAAVRTQIPIADVIGEHIALKGSETSMKGLCPFHQERTPSFNVNSTTNTFYCFGCEESGDVIDFIQQIEGEGFRWAVSFLADRYNITVSFDAEGDNGESTKKARLLKAHELAAKAYAYALKNDPEAQPARDQLTSRGFNVEDSITRFGCGYAPTNRSISQLLTSKGFTQEEITEAGLAHLHKGTLRDRFQGRLLWTIRNSFGKPIGFGARKLSDSDPIDAKFINTSETPIYKKSEVLFGLDLARKEITRTRQAIVVEGYTDVMAMHLAGKTNAVAACGTAFGQHHMYTLRRLVGDAGEVVFGFDDDEAGQKAARAAYRDFNSELRRLSSLPRSGGLDPDDLRRAKGDAALQEFVENRVPLSEAVILTVVEHMPQETPEDRIAALDAALTYLNDISDQLVRHEYAVKVARLLHFNPAQVESRITPTSGPEEGESSSQQVQAAVKPDWVEKEALRVFAQSEEIARKHFADWDLDLKFHQSASSAALAILRKGLSAPREGGLAWPLHLKNLCRDDSEVRLIAALTASSLPVAVDAAGPYADELMARLEQLGHERTLDALKEKIASASTSEDRGAALRQLMAHQRQMKKDNT